MPSISTSPSLGGSTFLSPRIFPQSTTSSALISPEQKQELTRRMFNTRYQENRGTNVFERIGGYAIDSVIDLGDTLAASLTPAERGDVWNLVGDYGGTAGRELQDFYNRNQAGVEMLSGVIGAVGTAYLGGSMLLPRISGAMARSTSISSSRLWQWGARTNAATRARMLEAHADAAAAGEAFSIWKNAAGRAYALNRVGKNVAVAGFEEGLIGLTMHENAAVWSDDMSTNLMFAGLGLGIGGAIGTIGYRAEMRRIANSAEQIKARIDAIDPQGISQLYAYQPETDIINAAKNVEMKESGKTTAFALAARQATPENATPAMSQRMDTIRSENATLALESLQKQASRGLVGVSGTNFRIDGGVKETVTELMNNDPTVWHGLNSLGLLRGKTLDEVLGEFANNVDELSHAEEAGKIREGRILEGQQMVLFIDNAMMPASTPEAKAISHFRPGNTEIRLVAKNTSEFAFKTESSSKVRTVKEDFDIKGFENLPIVDKMQSIEALHRVFADMKLHGTRHNVPQNPTWFQLDAAIEFERLGGKVGWHTAKGGVDEVINADAAQRISLKKKATAIGESSIGSPWERLQWNLPLPNSLERIYDGAGDSLRAVLDAALVDGVSTVELQALRAEMRNMHGFDVRRADDIPLTGNIFRFNRDSKGNWKELIVGAYDNEKMIKPLNQAGIAEQIAENKIGKVSILRRIDDEKPDNGIVPAMTDQLLAMPALRPAMAVGGLADDQMTGIGGAVSQLGGEVLTREMRARDSEIILSVLRVREEVNRWTDAHLRNMLSREFGDLNVRINSAPASGSKTLLNQVLSNAQGWDLEDDLVLLAPGKYGFALKDNAHNAARLGRKVEKDELLVNPRTNVEIAVDDLSLKWLNAFNRISKDILADKNRLRGAMGLSSLNERNWYFPPRDTRGKFVAFVADENKQPIPGGLIVANTRSEFEDLIREKNAELAKTKSTNTIVTREQHPSSADLWERAAMDWIDPGVGAAPAMRQRGVLSMETINPNAVGDTLEWIKTQTEQIGTNTLRVLFDSQLGIARARGATERAVRGLKAKTNVGKKIDERLRTIWDEYESIVMGRNLGDQHRSISGSLMHPVESIINGGIEAVWPALRTLPTSQAYNWISDVFDRVGLKTPKTVKTFKQLSAQLGEFTPYKNATDYAEQTLRISRPPEIRDIAQKLNQLSAALMLRYFELPHAAMNLIGVMTTMPSVIRSGRAPVTTFFETRHGRIGIVDTFKILKDSMGDMLTKRASADWDHMVRNGDTIQQVAEFNKEMALVSDRGSFARVFLGTGSKQGKTGVKGLFKEKGIDGLISVATDTTENWSRTFSHFVGLRLADIQGVTGMEARHAFAREIANSAIANYNPMNRPELYQSAFGSMFGLFMSWMQAYNQRLFRWMENKEYGNVAHQLAIQTTLFGLASNPGYKLVENALLSGGIGKTEQGENATLTDHIYAKFGPIVGSAIAHGSLQELGVVLYTRGDMNFRDVSLDPTRLMAGFGVTAKAATAFKESMQTLFNPYSLEDSGRLAEVLTRNMPNRVMKGVMIQALTGGKDIDARGQIISENRNFFESAVRSLGLRTQRQQAEIEAFYANRQAQDREAARMEVLRNETRSLIRNAGWESNLQSVFDKYVSAGGQPSHFRTWIRDQIRASSSTRGVNALAKAMTNPKNQSEVWRYEMYGGNQ